MRRLIRNITRVIGSLTFDISDMVGHPEARRDFSGERQVSLSLGDASIDGPMQVDGEIRGAIDGVIVGFRVSATAHLTCVRCLREWDETVEASSQQHFGKTPDEDGYAIDEGRIDVSGPATDELGLALPAAPLCRQECKGLCPICGTDLNSDPCDGHGEESDSPFAVLKDLFDS